MGKDSKSSKQSDAGKSGGDGSKAAADKMKKKKAPPEMTSNEALLAYKINIKDRALEDAKYERNCLEEQRDRNLQRNEQLKREQVTHMRNLLHDVKEFEKTSAQMDVVSKDQVITAMMANWETKRVEEQQVADLNAQILLTDQLIMETEQQVTYWSEYKEHGQNEHAKQIRLLEQELQDMQEAFDEMKEHLERTMAKTKEEIEKHSEELLDQQKYKASEKAIAKLDKYSRREVIDNDWLKREVTIHRLDTEQLLKVVEKLEEENLKSLSELFECQAEDLHIAKNVFMTQFLDGENLCEDDILQVDLNSTFNKRHEITDYTVRPKSATQRAVEQKLALLDELVEDEDVATKYENLDDEQREELEAANIADEESGDVDDQSLNYFKFDDEHLTEYLKLGPLEVKLLSVKGERVSMCNPITGLPMSRYKACDEIPMEDDWPITRPMIKQALHTPIHSPRSPATTHPDCDALL